jgi:hypothetical protein
VWVVEAEVPDGTITRSVVKSDAQAVRVVVDPETLLSAAAQERLDAYDDNPVVRERLRRNVAVTAGGVAVALAASALVRRLRAGPRRSGRRRSRV